jgi:hypothetical protein
MAGQGQEREQASMPAKWQNRIELTFVIDNHIVDSDIPEAVELRRLDEQGWIDLVLTDVTKTEWRDADPDRHAALLDQAVDYGEVYGPMVLGHSRIGRSVLGSAEDEDRLGRVFGILFPGTDLLTARKQHIRDAMNVATAIRYGVNCFVTNDRRLLNKRDAIKAAFNDFLVTSPEAALAFARRMIKRYEARTAS